MSTAVATLTHDSVLPESTPGCLTLIGTLNDSIEISRNRAYWLIGRVLNTLKEERGVKSPKKLAAQTLAQGERFFAYCQAVNRAYTWDMLRHLSDDHGLSWSLVRELASSTLDATRDSLIGMLDEGTITPEELAVQIARSQSDHSTAGQITDGNSREDIVAKFKKMVDKVRVLSEKLDKALEPAGREFSGEGSGLSTALIGEDGGRDSETEALVTVMNSALQRAIVEGVRVLRRANLAVVQDDWPFAELDEVLDEFRDQYDAEGNLVEPAESTDMASVQV